MQSKIPTTFYQQKKARIGNYSIEFALCTDPTLENRQERRSLKRQKKSSFCGKIPPGGKVPSVLLVPVRSSLHLLVSDSFVALVVSIVIRLP